MAIPEELMRRVKAYATRHETAILVDNPLGFGQDGAVWKSGRATAIKAIERERNYHNERDAYLRLKQQKISKIGIFDVPQLAQFDDELWVVEMGIVSPPFLLDFGKACVDREPPYTAEQITESIDEARKLFDSAQWPAVEEFVLDLKLMGITYLDIKPANIRVG